jgi:predicted nucleic-acid-binding protein
MIGIDTNVLIRFLVNDDPEQGHIARDLFARLTPDNPGFLPREALLESVSVLERAYRFDRATICRTIEGLLESREIVIEAADEVGLALSRYARGGAGFADQLIIAISQKAGCSTVYTFDRMAAKEPGATLPA